LISDALKIARIADKRADKDAMLSVLKGAVSDPLLVGLAALVGNELAFRAGLYAPAKHEVEESELGGPVWITIGPSLPLAQKRRNLINGMIIGVTTAKAIAPMMPAIIQGGLNAGKAIALVAGGV